MPLFLDITGKRFGKLVAQKIAYKGRRGHYYWHCDCDCGNKIIAKISYLQNGKLTSCGKCFFLTYRNKTQSINKWSLETGISYAILKARLAAGLSIAKVLDPTLSNKETRKKAEKERRLVLLAIENISSTLTARKNGKGATVKEIQEYTKIPRIGVTSALKWLSHKNLIYNIRYAGWLIKNPLPANDFCFKHGFTETINNVCIKCFNERKEK